MSLYSVLLLNAAQANHGGARLLSLKAHSSHGGAGHLPCAAADRESKDAET